MFHGFGPLEAVVIIAIILIVFGAGKLPQVGGALGKGIREFRKGKSGDLEESKKLESSNNQENKQDN